MIEMQSDDSKIRGGRIRVGSAPRELASGGPVAPQPAQVPEPGERVMSRSEARATAKLIGEQLAPQPRAPKAPGALPPAGADVRLVHDAETGELVIRFESEGELLREIRCARPTVLDLLGAGDLGGLSPRVDRLMVAARAMVAKYDDDQHGDIRGIDEQVEALRDALGADA